MSLLKLLWIDMTFEGSAPGLPPGFADRCRVVRARTGQSLDQQLRNSRADAVLFDFDYPDRASLGVAAKLKATYRSVPMVVMTVQHSEALAVWAFRARFLDFLVRPVCADDVDRCLRLLREIVGERRTQALRQAPVSAAAIPAEVPAAVVSASAVQPAVEFIEGNLGSRIMAEDMAKLCGMSPFRFSRAFREAFGITFRDYLMRVRLTEAARMLENPQVAVAQVAIAVGFNDMSHFSQLFRRQFGLTPSAARGAIRGRSPPVERHIELPGQNLP